MNKKTVNKCISVLATAVVCLSVNFLISRNNSDKEMKSLIYEYGWRSGSKSTLDIVNDDMKGKEPLSFDRINEARVRDSLSFDNNFLNKNWKD